MACACRRGLGTAIRDGHGLYRVRSKVVRLSPKRTIKVRTCNANRSLQSPFHLLYVLVLAIRFAGVSFGDTVQQGFGARPLKRRCLCVASIGS